MRAPCEGERIPESWWRIAWEAGARQQIRLRPPGARSRARAVGMTARWWARVNPQNARFLTSVECAGFLHRRGRFHRPTGCEERERVDTAQNCKRDHQAHAVRDGADHQ